MYRILPAMAIAIFLLIVTLLGIILYEASLRLVWKFDSDRRAFMVECIESGKRKEDCALLWRYK